MYVPLIHNFASPLHSTFKGEGGKEKAMRKNIYLIEVKNEFVYKEMVLAVTEREPFSKVIEFVEKEWGSSDSILLLHEGETEVQEEPPKILHSIEVRSRYDELKY